MCVGGKQMFTRPKHGMTRSFPQLVCVGPNCFFFFLRKSRAKLLTRQAMLLVQLVVVCGASTSRICMDPRNQAQAQAS